MLKIKEYRKVKDLEEAYELNQKKSACVLGGMVWLKWETVWSVQLLIYQD